MSAVRRCRIEGCNGWMLWGQYACNECNGANARASYRERTTALVICLQFAAVEEMRFRATAAKLKRLPLSDGGEGC